MTSENLNQAIALIKAGNKQAALPILKEVIQANPHDENAWLWLYSCVDKVEQKKVCLQKALEINPGNLQAHNALRNLTDLPSQLVQQNAPVKATQRQLASQNELDTNRKKQRWLFELGGVGLILFLCIIVTLYLAQTGKISALAANLPFFPSSTLTSSLVPTATATITPSPSTTATETVTSSPSPTATETALPPTITSSPITTSEPALIAPLEDLESYRLQGKTTMESDIFLNITQNFTMEWVKASLAQRTTASIQYMPDTSGTGSYGQPPAPTPTITTMEKIIIDKTAWMRFDDGGWSQFDSQSSLYQKTNMENLVSNWQNLKPLGDEIINGIHCIHYTIDEDTQKISSFDGQDTTSMITHVQGDIWVANQPGLPSVILRAKIRQWISHSMSSLTTDTPDPLMSVATQEPRDLITYLEYEVTDINTVIVIEPPKMTNK